MIDPLERWREHGEKPDFAGLLSFGGAPYTQDPAVLAGFDVAIVGAPTDDLVSDRPGARFGPRAIRAASCPLGRTSRRRWTRSRSSASSTSATRRSCLPTRPLARGDQETVGQVLDAGPIPIVLGGDHSIAEPDIRAVAAHHGPVGLVHFDTHTDTGREVFGVEVSHGTPMYRLVEAGTVDPARYVQIGLRGYWPGEESSRGRPSAGSRASSCTTCDATASTRSSRGRSTSSARGRSFCPSTSTCSTRPSLRGPERRSRAG